MKGEIKNEQQNEGHISPSELNAGLGVFILEIERNAEGGILAFLGKEGASSSYRIAGPKAWGGSRNIAKLKISERDLVEFIKSYAPEIIPLLMPNA